MALLATSAGVGAAESLPVPIKRQAVKSTSLASMGYNEPARALELEFRTGAIYRYEAVPPIVFEEMLKAASKGRYFSEKVRGKFRFQQLREPKR
ncbi:MAG: hypothetical protein JWQ44_2147 [Chthoniobacter sp.]|nr:hypothetical protein [Chthoniobacter sp.]